MVLVYAFSFACGFLHGSYRCGQFAGSFGLLRYITFKAGSVLGSFCSPGFFTFGLLVLLRLLHTFYGCGYPGFCVGSFPHRLVLLLVGCTGLRYTPFSSCSVCCQRAACNWTACMDLQRSPFCCRFSGGIAPFEASQPGSVKGTNCYAHTWFAGLPVLVLHTTTGSHAPVLLVPCTALRYVLGGLRYLHTMDTAPHGSTLAITYRLGLVTTFVRG